MPDMTDDDWSMTSISCLVFFVFHVVMVIPISLHFLWFLGPFGVSSTSTRKRHVLGSDSIRRELGHRRIVVEWKNPQRAHHANEEESGSFTNLLGGGGR